MLQPIDISVERNILTAYDGTAANPSLGYQFGLGSIGAFRHIGTEQATSAGVSTQVTFSQNIVLPLGLIITNRYQRLTLRNWSQQLDSIQAVGDGTQRNFPDIGVRWNVRFTAPTSPLSSFAITARVVGTEQLISSPGAIDSASNAGETHLRNYPMTFTAVWAGTRPLTTTFGANVTQSLDNRPGVSGRGNGLDISADVARAFALPADWHARSDLRTHLSYQNSTGQSYVLNPLAIGGRSTLTDNGRHSLSLSADTDVGENLSSSFIISRVSTFDNNFDRQFTQTVLSAVLHLQFYAGDLK
jgi:hypothetical protein